ncbi:TAXI family TRAP transporter solute-binding subunit [Motilimonas eburnea]|uniref:TAXI family TRAP transporter solute-binding subunit n=1 Tax=Motilimonas eburnea TaxID=1737488 RepID=UPI001E41D8F7|nr:TAXI family TRAP transporter solute-binding subunit [Motilimonas eburnea]MCE2571285.1 TAXI family TRAP transporter solute-binding subunit [Motilimonas eburnea]
MRKSLFTSLYFAACALLTSHVYAEQIKPKLVTIASGSTQGIYFQVASEICRLTSASKAEHGYRCGAIPTEGSEENLTLLLAGEVDFAIVQSDTLYFAAQQYPSQLQAVLATHAEPLTIVTTPDAEIQRAMDLNGKILNIGGQGSGTNTSLKRLLAVPKWDQQPQVTEDNNWEAFENLCLGEIDAYAAIIGHPNRLVNRTSKRCDIQFVSVNSQALADSEGNLPPYLMPGHIPGRLYRGNKEKTPTISFSANLVTRKDVDPAYVKAVAKAIFGQEKSFGKNITAYANVFRSIETMTGDAVVIPLHPQVEQLKATAQAAKAD